MRECLKQNAMRCRARAARHAERSWRTSFTAFSGMTVDTFGASVYFRRRLPDVLPYMLYSATTEYAIRALAYMATLPPGERSLARDLADATHVPRQFLGKILHRLARHGLLESAKGRGGGFRFARSPDGITVGEVVGLVEGPDLLAQCVLG